MKAYYDDKEAVYHGKRRDKIELHVRRAGFKDQRRDKADNDRYRGHHRRPGSDPFCCFVHGDIIAWRDERIEEKSPIFLNNCNIY